MTRDPVSIVGGGAWGTALAVVLGERETPVRLWMREDDVVARMRARRDNPVYLPGIRVPEAVAPTTRLDEAIRGAALVVFAVPSPFARPVYDGLRAALAPAVPVAVATKGIEEGSLLLPTQVA